MSAVREAAVAPFVHPLDESREDALLYLGGKGANLAELAVAGFSVSHGFVVSTAAYDAFVRDNGLDGTLARAPWEEEGIGARVRAEFEKASIPSEVEEEILTAYRAFGETTVAVRSSATAEDLPSAAFAGQQDTFLNVSGERELLVAVRRCWTSLYTDRAIAYRLRQGVDHATVKLAAVVQRMVDAKVAGVLFTANPVTGKRRQAVVDASPGLGEAVVSGAVRPDHFVIDTTTGEIVERSLGGTSHATAPVAREVASEAGPLSVDQLGSLARLGQQVEVHFGGPQDIEWAIDGGGKLWVLQARPITTLFPLPDGTPPTDEELRVYFSFNIAQGVYRPLTPMGLQAFRVAAGSATALFGLPPRDPYAGPGFLAEAGCRLFLDLTAALRTTAGRRLLHLAMRNVEARAELLLRDVEADPRLSLLPTRRRSLARAVMSAARRTRLPARIADALLRPQTARARAASGAAELRTAELLPGGASARERLAAAERVLFEGPPRVPLAVSPGLAAGFIASALGARLLSGLAGDDERRLALRGLAGNPTTEMNLSLWEVAREAERDPESARALRDSSPERLAEEYLAGALPPRLQGLLGEFLRAYGHRGVAEIDLGIPRWSEDPTHVFGAISNYLRNEDSERAPDVNFRRATAEGEAMVGELTRRARERSRVRGALVGFFLGRARALLGLREMPKFSFILIFARARALLWPVGEELAAGHRLDAAGDIFFLTLPEAKRAVEGADLRARVRERHATYARELRRRHLPRVLLSDGTEPEAAKAATYASAEGALVGTPASAGTATGPARVILDPTGARLAPGEILIAPSTDPGWTPLFLTAAGLVMEMGGPVSHGAIVAREYGIPAVVGVPDAAKRIRTGEEITVDGSSGVVSVGR
jgi:rifampicin phosphotransferase